MYALYNTSNTHRFGGVLGHTVGVTGPTDWPGGGGIDSYAMVLSKSFAIVQSIHLFYRTE